MLSESQVAKEKDLRRYNMKRLLNVVGSVLGLLIVGLLVLALSLYSTASADAGQSKAKP